MNKASRVASGMLVCSAFFIVAGSLHFIFPGPYLRIIPSLLPAPRMLVWLSGAAEILVGAGLLPRFTRAVAAYGLALLLIVIFPANVYMAVAHISFPGLAGNPWVQWLRLPLQIPLIWWVLQYGGWRGGEAHSAAVPSARKVQTEEQP